MNEVGPAIAQETTLPWGYRVFTTRTGSAEKMGISQVNAVFIEAFEDVSEPSLMTSNYLITSTKHRLR